MRIEQPRDAKFQRGESGGTARLVTSGPAGVRAEPSFVAASNVLQVFPAEPQLQGEQFPPLPTLLATRLQLELLLADRPVDLRAAAGILMNDLGATLGIFRRAGEECGGGSNTPERLEECLASLGTDAWMEAVCAGAVERMADDDEEELAELTGFWEHGRLLAYACWLVAEQIEGVCPDEAFLVGLLHEAARLPALLGWSTPVVGSRDANVRGLHACSGELAQKLALHWHLPRYLWPVLAKSSLPSRWTRLLELAHAWSRCEDCLLTHIA
jgi:HD-like signal output (HDOD) protein